MSGLVVIRTLVVLLPTPLMSLVVLRDNSLAGVCRATLVAVIVLVVVGRIAWFGDFLRRCWTASKGHAARASIAWRTVHRTSNQFQRGTPDRHRRLLGLEAHRLDTMLVGGSIALAAWSQLFVARNSEPASRLSEFTLGCLAGGAACLIAGPLIWRSEGSHLTMMGRISTLEVGFTLIGASLASVAVDLGESPAMVIAIIAFVVIGVRDSAATWTWIFETHPELAFSADH